MIGITTMTISKEQMIAIVEHYLNENLFATAFRAEHKAKVIDQIRKTGDRFVITFEGANAGKPRDKSLDLPRPTPEAIGVVNSIA